MMLARGIYAFSILLAVLLMGMSVNGIYRFPTVESWVFAGIVFVLFLLALRRSRVSRVVVGVVYGLYALQAFLFAFLGIPASEGAWLFAEVMGIALFFGGMGFLYFTYGPLKEFLRRPEGM